MPQAPQFCGSELRATQASLQSDLPLPHRDSQAPPLHRVVPFTGGTQVASQAPQFAASFWRLTQRPAHSLKPGLHSSEQVPLQIAVAFGELEQAMLQPPQCFGSRVVSTQVSPQAVVPGGQSVTQAPSAHTCPAAHASQQPPQCAKVVRVSTQALPQSASPCPHVAPQVPSMQTASPSAGTSQALSHEPQ
jgi:hypothetical protein